MPENNTNTSNERRSEAQTVDRRTYLKLAGAAGSGIGAGIGTGALGTEFTAPARAASVVEDFNYSSSSEMRDHYHFDMGESNASLETVSSTATSDASDSVLEISGGNTKMVAYDDNDGSDLTAYPQVGETITCWIRGTNATENMNVIYGAVDGDGRDDHYYVKVDMDKSTMGIGVVDDGNATWLQSAPEDPSFSTNAWYKLEIQWNDASPNTHDVTLSDQSGNSVASLSYDGSDSADPGFEGRGLGYSAYLSSSSEAAQFDYAKTDGTETEMIGQYDTVEDFINPEGNGLNLYDFDRGSSGAEIVEATDYSGPSRYTNVYNGRRSLKLSENYTEMISTSGLSPYPSAGDTFACYFMPSGGADNFNFTWGVQGHDNRYYVKIKPESGSMHLFKYKNSEGDVLDSTSGMSMPQDKWYYIEIDWSTDGNQRVELYNIKGDTLATVSGSDSEWTKGGIGFDAYIGSGESVFFDHLILGNIEYHKGGWGAVHIGDEERVDASDVRDRIEDFDFFLDYDGRDTLGSDKYVHYFTIAAVGHSYTVPDGEQNPAKDEVEPANFMERTEATIDLSDLSDGNTQYLHWNDQKTYAFVLDESEWFDWKEDNWAEWEDNETLKENAIDETDLNRQEENNGPFDLIGDMLSFVPVVGDFVAGTNILRHFFGGEEYDCEYEEQLSENSIYLKWDGCNRGPFIGQLIPFRIEIPKNEGLNVEITQEFTIPTDSWEELAALNAADWEVHIPQGETAELANTEAYSTQ